MTKRKASSAVGVMVCLDSILDTRKGTIKRLYPEVYEEIKASPKYHLRKEDRWDEIDARLDHQKITLSYQGRNVETIRHSQLTMVSRMLLELFADLSVDIRGNDPEASSFFLVINFHPYKLTQEFKTEFARLLSIQLGIVGVPVGEVSIPWNRLNPTFLKDNNIRYWYCYHYEEWLRENFEPIGTEAIDKDNIPGCPEVKMFAPSIAQNQKAIDEFIAGIDDCPYTDQFQLTKAITSNIINFEFTPVASFCQLDAEKLQLLEKEKDMERSEILNTQEKAVHALMLRLGEKPLVSKKRAEQYLDELEQILFDLRAFNTKEGFTLFKQRLAMLNLSVSKLYNSVPFNSGEDLEELLDHLSLSVDTAEEDYLKTEKFWNDKGVETIRVVEEVGTGERIYRCVASSASEEHGVHVGDILKPQSKKPRPMKPADAINFLNYFEN